MAKVEVYCAMDVNLDAQCINTDDHTAFNDPQPDFRPVSVMLTEPAGRILSPYTIS
jgi:hypothetical protein